MGQSVAIAAAREPPSGPLHFDKHLRRAYGLWLRACYDRDGEAAREALRSAGSHSFALTLPDRVYPLQVDSPALWEVLFHLSAFAAHVIRRAAGGAFMGNAVLLGSPGTGKTTLARAIHAWSGRRGSFCQLDAGGLNAEIILSELFGHVKGAFTSASKSRQGLVEVAEGGTILIDEFLDLAELQGPLLRLLQDGTYRPVGSDRDKRARDLVVVLATNAARTAPELEALVPRRLRPDLHGRFGPILQVPDLAGQRETIRSIALAEAKHFDIEIEPGLMEWLTAQPWPGNIRELVRVIELASVYLPPEERALVIPEHLARTAPRAAKERPAPTPTSTTQVLAAEILREHESGGAKWSSLVRVEGTAKTGVEKSVLRAELLEEVVRQYFSSRPSDAELTTKAELDRLLKSITGKLARDLTPSLPKGRGYTHLIWQATRARLGALA